MSADAVLEIDTSDLLKASQQLGIMSSDFAKMVNSIVADNNKLIKAKENYASVSTEAIAAATDANAKAAAAEAASVAKQAAALDKLKQKYDPLYGAQQKYNKALAEIKTLRANDVISIEQEIAALAQLNKEYAVAQTRIAATGNAINQFGDFSGFAGAKINKFGMQAQGVSYQIADMAVQAQMGTNWLIILGQQGSQIAGYFGGVGAAVGAGLAIGTAAIYALTKAFGDSKDSAEDLHYKLSDFDDLEPLFASVGASMEDSLGGALDRVSAKYGDLIAMLARRDAERMVSGIKDAYRSNSEDNTPGVMSYVTAPFRALTHFGSEGTISGQTEQLEDQKRIYEEIYDIVDQLNGLTPDQISESWAGILEQVQQIDGITEQQVQQFVDLADQLGIIDNIKKNNAKTAEDEAQQTQRINEFVSEQVLSLQEKNTLLAIEQQYGQDSLQYLQAQLAFDRQHQLLKMAILTVSEEDQQMLLQILDANAQIEMQLAANAEQARLLEEYLGLSADNAAALASIDITSGIQSAVAAAAALTANMVSAVAAANAFNAARAAGVAIMNLASGPGGVTGAISRGAFSVNSTLGGLYNSAMHNIPAPPPPSMTLPGTRPSNFGVDMDGDGIPDSTQPTLGRGGRGGGGGRGRSGGSGGAAQETDAQKAEKIMADLREQMDFQEELIGKNEEERDLLKHIQDIKEKLGDKEDEISQSRIEQLAKEQIATEKLLEAQQEHEQEMKQLTSTLEGDFKDAVMSVVEGTASIKDAFRDMLRKMILDIYEQQVMDKYTKYAGNFISSLFSGGFHASGGDVQGGRPIMVGERGRELFVPKSNGSIVANHDLPGSGGDTYVININNNVNANGDESVKKIIRQETPRIADYTKKAITDTKMRGGRTAAKI